MQTMLTNITNTIGISNVYQRKKGYFLHKGGWNLTQVMHTILLQLYTCKIKVVAITRIAHFTNWDTLASTFPSFEMTNFLTIQYPKAAPARTIPTNANMATWNNKIMRTQLSNWNETNIPVEKQMTLYKNHSRKMHHKLRY